MIQNLKQHWDTGVTFGGILAMITASQISVGIEIAIGLLTVLFLCFRAFSWFLKVRMEWRNRNNTSFWNNRHKSDDW